MKRAAFVIAACLACSTAYAQSDMGGMDMSGMPDMAHMDMPGMASTGVLGSYPMTRDASGTSWQPDAAEHSGVHAMLGDWSLMGHMMLWGIYDTQSGPRGDDKTFLAGMLMGMTRRDFGASDTLQFRMMLSPDPIMGKSGYPLLFATGETANGATPLIDRQHPHDLFMELSGRLDFKAGAGKFFIYGGLPGEPALGPSAFMHRASDRFDPEAPITHHWFDSTHITWGVLTAGWAAPRWQIEASAFKGREPDENRYNIETPKLDSWSVRATWNPTPAWSAEVSYGELHSPEALHPEQNEHRLIATVSYAKDGLAATAGYSRKAIRPGPVLPAWFAEATWAITPRHALFGRFENVRNDELFEREEQLGLDPPLAGEAFRVSKFTAGYAYTLPLGRNFALALGAAASAYAKPRALDEAYGKHPHSLTLFAKLMLGR